MDKYLKLYKTSAGFIFAIVLIELVVGYGFVSLAIDRGNLWWYILAIIFLVRAIKDLFRFLGKIINGRKYSSAK